MKKPVSRKAGSAERTAPKQEVGPPGMMVKIEEVARRAGVSTATVSRVFNHHPSIRPELRRRVLEVAREDGYRPRLSVRQRNVVIITPYDPVWPVHSCVEMILLALTQEMPRRGFRLEILPSSNSDRLDAMQFCAAIAIGAEPSAFAGWAERFAVPLVILDRNGKAAPPSVCYVRSDEAQGMELAIGHLRERGCRRIGCIIHGDPDTGNAGVRHAAILKALKARKLPCDESLVLFSGMGSGKYVELIGKLLKRRVDALFCPGGNAGLVALYAFSLYGRRVPEEISVIASEQTGVTSYTVPPLTTITPDYQALAAATAGVIETYLEGGTPAGCTILPYGLIRRESVTPDLEENGE